MTTLESHLDYGQHIVDALGWDVTHVQSIYVHAYTGIEVRTVHISHGSPHHWGDDTCQVVYRALTIGGPRPRGVTDCGEIIEPA